MKYISDVLCTILSMFTYIPVICVPNLKFDSTDVSKSLKMTKKSVYTVQMLLLQENCVHVSMSINIDFPNRKYVHFFFFKIFISLTKLISLDTHYFSSFVKCMVFTC